MTPAPLEALHLRRHSAIAVGVLRLFILCVLGFGAIQQAEPLISAVMADPCCADAKPSADGCAVVSPDGCCAAEDGCASNCAECIRCAAASSLAILRAPARELPSRAERFQSVPLDVRSFDEADEILHVPISST